MARAVKTKKIRKGDDVIVIAGKDKGRTGSVLRVMPKENRVLVQGVNMIKRHMRPSASSPGGIDEREASLHISNVALIDPETNKATRVGFKFLEDKRKIRVARPSGAMID